MQGKLPLPTDNIFKFYALFGLVLFIFSASSMLYVNKTTNDLVYQVVVDVEILKHVDKKTHLQEVKQTTLERKLKIALADKEFFLYAIGAMAGLSLLLMYYGFMHWHTKIQPLQDELTRLTIKKLKKDLNEHKSFKPRI